MNKFLHLIIIALVLSSSVIAQTIDTVSIGTGYANQVWYSLDSNERATAVGTSWDLGFQISGFSSAIIANTAYGAELYKYPNGDITDWATLDTSGIDHWTPWHNPSNTWDQGAFNIGIDTNNSLDLGWGIYNFINHQVTGDSLFVWKTANGSIYKIWVQNLASGTYNFLVSDYSGVSVDTIALSKINFVGKNFGYYSIANSNTLDIEPASNSWDMFFSKYMEEINGIPYSVSGVRTNVGIEAVKVYPINNVNSYDSAQIHTYSSDIDIIGHNWKEFNFSTSGYDIEDSTVYFVKTDTNTYWKLVMKDFGGSSNGNYIFEKTKVTGITGLFEKPNSKNGSFKIYPNPTTDRSISIQADLPATVKNIEVKILNINGQLLNSKRVQLNSTSEVIPLKIESYKTGIYFIQLHHSSGTITQRLIIN